MVPAPVPNLAQAARLAIGRVRGRSFRTLALLRRFLSPYSPSKVVNGNANALLQGFVAQALHPGFGISAGRPAGRAWNRYGRRGGKR